MKSATPILWAPREIVCRTGRSEPKGILRLNGDPKMRGRVLAFKASRVLKVWGPSRELDSKVLTNRSARRSAWAKIKDHQCKSYKREQSKVRNRSGYPDHNAVNCPKIDRLPILMAHQNQLWLPWAKPVRTSTTIVTQILATILKLRAHSSSTKKGFRTYRIKTLMPNL